MNIIHWLGQRPALEVFEAMLLMPIAGIAIFQMKRWSYGVFFLATSWSILSNFRHWHYAQQSVPMPALIGIYLLQIALVTYFLLPGVRVTYFNPRVRWWESKPRFRLALPASMAFKTQTIQGDILNVSEGGCFVKPKSPLLIGDELKLGFEILSQQFEIAGRIVHSREIAPGEMCYGIQFDHTTESASRFRGLTLALRALGFQDRVSSKTWHAELKEWAVTLAKTGKGLVPDVKR